MPEARHHSPADSAPARAEHPVADLSQKLTGRERPFIGSGIDAEVPETYAEDEFVATGVATDYVAGTPLAAHGRWELETATSAGFRTRVLVRRPRDPAAFSGTVLVEWLNVSGGVDAHPEYDSLEDEILRRGHAWVGVSAQRIGVEGGPVRVEAPGGEGRAGRGLKTIDPERYGSLSHPGDGFSFDIFTQVAQALCTDGDLLGGREPPTLLAVGESQSAFALTTYYNGVQPLTRAFDGFLVHSRGSVGLPLAAPGEHADMADAFMSSDPALVRSDLDTPVLVLQSEGDVVGPLNSVAVRQSDTDSFRLWEVAGTAHADVHLVGPLADSLDCGVRINNGPMHVVAKAALRRLETWVRTGALPPPAPRLAVTDSHEPNVHRDRDGIALGGVRTPPVDVPVDVLSGKPGPSPDPLCILLGSTRPLPDTRLTELYASKADYEHRYAAALDAAVEAGFVLGDDRDTLAAYAQPSRISW